ncbi:MAG: hypothetical protein EXR71_04140 [Myxococcales bacterium]|nr:hypothetical protein [Myxococcales bacterium]
MPYRSSAALIGLFALAACGTAVDDAVVDAVPARLDTLVVGVKMDPNDLLSPLAQAAFDLSLIDLIGARPLTAEFDCELTFLPDFASSTTWSEDGKSLTLELRQDLAWSDGAPVTPRDLGLLADLVRDPAVGSLRAGNLALLTPESPVLVDANHLRYDFTARGDRTAMTANTTLLQLVPSHILGDPSFERAALRSHSLNTTSPLSSGRWVMQSWEKGKSVTLEPNPSYPGALPGLARVVFRIIPEYAARLLELQQGGIDLMESVQVADADALIREHPEIKLHTRGYRSQDYVGWNSIDPVAWKAELEAGKRPDPAGMPLHPLFADPDVRRALSTAVDVDRIIADALTSKASGKAYAIRSVSTITPELCATRENGITPLKYDAESSRATLAREGWTDTNGDGVVDRNGVPFRFTVIMPLGSARHLLVSAILQEQWKAIGVDAQFEAIAGGAMGERLRRRDFDAAFTGWSAGLWVDPSTVLGRASESNFFSYQNPKAQALIDQGVRETSPARATEIWNEFQRIVYDDQPYTFLYWLDEIVAVNGRFENTEIGLVSPYNNLERWTVAPEKVKYKQ